MHPRSKVLVVALTGIVLVGHLTCSVKRTEYWPFSRYSMYAGYTPEIYERHLLRGVTAAGEVPLYQSRYFWPFDWSRLSYAMKRLDRMNDPARMTAALANLASIYERRREAGDHSGAPLLELRLYRHKWRLVSDPITSPPVPTLELLARYVVPGQRL